MATGTTILECLTGYIGLYSCDGLEPGSGLYINDLPGISSEVLQLITDPEEETFANTWANIEKRAILRFRTELLSQVNQCYQVNDMDVVECLACAYKDLLSVPLWYLLGNFAMIEALSSWQNSHLSTINRVSVEEIRDQYFVDFQRELAAAVKGIDVLNSDCIEKKCCLPQNGRVFFRESMM
jgi:hypothetical protein